MADERPIEVTFFDVKGKPIRGKALQNRLTELRTHGGVSFSFTGECLSVYDNRDELDPEVKDPWGLPVAKTFYKHHPYDLEASRFALDRIVKVMVDAGASNPALTQIANAYRVCESVVF
jgi:hypothetical protein